MVDDLGLFVGFLGISDPVVFQPAGDDLGIFLGLLGASDAIVSLFVPSFCFSKSRAVVIEPGRRVVTILPDNYGLG